MKWSLVPFLSYGMGKWESNPEEHTQNWRRTGLCRSSLYSYIEKQIDVARGSIVVNRQWWWPFQPSSAFRSPITNVFTSNFTCYLRIFLLCFVCSLLVWIAGHSHTQTHCCVLEFCVLVIRTCLTRTTWGSELPQAWVSTMDAERIEGSPPPLRMQNRLPKVAPPRTTFELSSLSTLENHTHLVPTPSKDHTVDNGLILVELIRIQLAQADSTKLLTFPANKIANTTSSVMQMVFRFGTVGSICDQDSQSYPDKCGLFCDGCVCAGYARQKEPREQYKQGNFSCVVLCHIRLKNLINWTSFLLNAGGFFSAQGGGASWGFGERKGVVTCFLTCACTKTMVKWLECSAWGDVASTFKHLFHWKKQKLVRGCYSMGPEEVCPPPPNLGPLCSTRYSGIDFSILHHNISLPHLALCYLVKSRHLEVWTSDEHGRVNRWLCLWRTTGHSEKSWSSPLSLCLLFLSLVLRCVLSITLSPFGPSRSLVLLCLSQTLIKLPIFCLDFSCSLSFHAPFHIVCLCVSSFVSVGSCLSVYISLFVLLSLFLSLSLVLSLSLFLTLSLFLSLSLFLCLCLSPCLQL